MDEQRRDRTQFHIRRVIVHAGFVAGFLALGLGVVGGGSQRQPLLCKIRSF
jgi:hypothetical protein